MADKYKKLKRQVSTDGGLTWNDMIPYEYIRGELIERNSPDCTDITWKPASGYICTEEEVTPVSTIKASFRYDYYDNEEGRRIDKGFDVPYNGSTVLTNEEIIAAADGVDMATFDKACGVRGRIADWVTEIGDNVLKTNAVVDVNVPSSVVRIGDNAYTHWYYDRYYDILNLPEGLTTIGTGSFNLLINGSGTITIPSTVTSIGESSFIMYGGLDNANIVVANGNQYYYTPEGANSGIVERPTMTMLVGNHSGTIPSGILKIGKSAFSEMRVTTLTIPNSVTEIGEGAFNTCQSLTSVTIGTGLTSIGESVFRGCRSLTSITIPTNVLSIGKYAFYGCSSLEIPTFNEGLQEIGHYAFYSGKEPTQNITIPSTVTKLGSRCITPYGVNITVLATTPPVAEALPFDGGSYAGPGHIYVPAGSVNTYKNATNWSYYASLIEAIPT